MVDTNTEVAKVLDKLNGLLSKQGVSPFKIGVANPKDFVKAPKNARYMLKDDYMQLVENIRKDSGLSSLPFVWKDKDGSLRMLSGHHRAEAAADAGIESILFLYTDDDLTKSQQLAIQLSHNELSGRDNPEVLRELWEEIENVELKMYSGLDDVKLETYESVQLQSFTEMDLNYRSIALVFVDDEVEKLDLVLARIESESAKMYAGSYKDWTKFLDTIIEFKERKDIKNTATAFKAMIDIVTEHLDGLE